MKSFFTKILSVSILSAHLASPAPGILPLLDHQRREQSAPAAFPSTAPSNASLSSRWPVNQYSLRLSDDFQLIIYPTKPYTQQPLPAVAPLKDFIRDFASNVKQAYPPPALAPRKAGQSCYDAESSTKWIIEELVLPITSSRAPTAIVLEGLKQFSLQVAQHGPPAESSSLIVGRKKPGARKNYPFNALKFFIESLGSGAGQDVPDVLNLP
ncbi:MAG: hypothetical protein Q9191_001929, partial [Dirinaria sp. TL-2023a]